MLSRQELSGKISEIVSRQRRLPYWHHAMFCQRCACLARQFGDDVLA